MALVIAPISNAPRVDHETHGRQTHQCFVTVQAADYTVGQGLPIQANAAKFGFRQVWGVQVVSVRQGGSTYIAVWGSYQEQGGATLAGKLRLWKGSAEVTTGGGGDITDNTVLDLLVWGV